MPSHIVGLEVARVLACEALPARAPEAVVWFGGSLAEGLGNAWSDVDLFVLSDRSPVGELAMDGGVNRVVQHYVGGRRFDWEYWRPDDVEALATRVDGLSLGTRLTLTRTELSFIEEVFLHRLRTGVPLMGDRGHRELVARVDWERLARWQVQESLRQLDAWLEDLVGMVESDDLDSALLLTAPALEQVLGAWVHHLGITDPTPKWRLRRLQALDDDPVTAGLIERFWALRLPGKVQVVRKPATTRGHVEAVVRWANEVAAAIQGGP